MSKEIRYGAAPADLSAYLPLVGGTMLGHIYVGTDSAYDLGDSTKYWRFIYTDGVQLNANASIVGTVRNDKMTFDITGNGYYEFKQNAITKVLIQTGNVQFSCDLKPGVDNSRGVGLSTTYWQNSFIHNMYLNSTAYLDGDTAGTINYNATVDHRFIGPKVTVQGDLYVGNNAHVDPAIVFDGDHNDGQISYLEDEDTFAILSEVEAGGATTKFKITSLGGMAIKLTNTTGANTVAGQLVKADTATNDAVILAAAGDVECIGVFLESGIADDAEAWVVVSGIADVAHDDNVAAVRGNWISTGVAAGYAATATSPAAAPTHFEEIGHCIESVAAGGGGTHILARCVLHFN